MKLFILKTIVIFILNMIYFDVDRGFIIHLNAFITGKHVYETGIFISIKWETCIYNGAEWHDIEV